MGEAAHGVGAPVTDALWLDTLHRVSARAAHEIRGALNGVSVNLEVVRSRAEKPDAPASNVKVFANAAAGQLDAVIAMTDALLTLARAVREPVELGTVTARFHALLAPAARADGKRLELEGELGDLGVTSATGNAVCLALGWCLLAAIDESGDVRCVAVLDEPEPGVRIEARDGTALAVAAEIVTAAAESGIHIVAESSAVSISFPR